MQRAEKRRDAVRSGAAANDHPARPQTPKARPAGARAHRADCRRTARDLGIRTQASFFYVPSELVHHKLPAEQQVRLGGMVEKGFGQDRRRWITIHFIVGDGVAKIPVRYAGIVPSLFTERLGRGCRRQARSRRDFRRDNVLASMTRIMSRVNSRT